MFYEGLRSERQLLRVVADRLSLRWYLGYDLSEPLPDHSSLTRIRERLGLPIFRRFFERVVELCQQADLIWGREVLVDATKVRGNAALASLVPRLAEVVDGHLVPLFAEGAKAEATESVAGEQAPRLLHPAAARCDSMETESSSMPWSPRPTSWKTGPCSTNCGGPSSAGSSARSG